VLGRRGHGVLALDRLSFLLPLLAHRHLRISLEVAC
jgi:hypothetical protein